MTFQTALVAIGSIPFLVTGACAGRPDSATVSRRDSSGVSIVESVAPSWRGRPRWSVGDSPLVDLATVRRDSAHEFGSASDAVRLPDGSIAVADPLAGQIRFFAAGGEFTGSVGSRGKGPGQFANLAELERFRGDSLIAFDPVLGRITVLDAGHAVGRTISVPFQMTDALRVVSDSMFIALVEQVSIGAKGTTGVYADTAHLVRFSPDGSVLDTLAAMPGQQHASVRRGSGWADVRPLLAAQPQLATADGTIYTGPARALEVWVISGSDGATRRMFRVPNLDLSLSPAAVEAERAAVLGPAPSPLKKELLAGMPDPAARPAYSALVADAEGYLWAEEANGAARWDDPTRWNVFAPNGEWMGSLQLPAKLSVFQIGNDWILGSLMDSLDVVHPVLLPLSRDPSG